MRAASRYEDRAYCTGCGHSAATHDTPRGCTMGWFCSCRLNAADVHTGGEVRTGQPVWNAVQLTPSTQVPRGWVEPE